MTCPTCHFCGQTVHNIWCGHVPKDKLEESYDRFEREYPKDHPWHSMMDHPWEHRHDWMFKTKP